jgi:hypothetical protein
MFLLSGLATASQISQIKVTSSLMSELVAAIAATTQDTQNNITLCVLGRLAISSLSICRLCLTSATRV